MFRKWIIVFFASSVLTHDLAYNDRVLSEPNNESDKVNDFKKGEVDKTQKFDGRVNFSELNPVVKYVRQQTKLLSLNKDNYIETLKTDGRGAAKLWATFLPIENDEHENLEETLSVPGLAARYGYDCETHTVESQGYILNIHRIPRPQNGGTVSKRTVILQHGLFGSSACWIANGPDRSLGFVLADAGYDVWMTNARGSKYSREHTWYTTETKEFWNFSFHEIAKYDTPAVIDYIEKIKSNDTKIAYVGYSMGTTILYAMLALRPEYNNKLTIGLALAPEVFLSNMKSPIKSGQEYIRDVAKAAMWFRSYEIAYNEILDKIYLNYKSEYRKTICKNIMFYIFGEDEEQLDSKALSSNKGNASWKTILHYMQMIDSGKFQQFDYGNLDNINVYGEDTPPEYDLQNVKLNTILFWAQNDLLSNEADVLLLHYKLNNTAQMYMVPYPKFNHLDYLWAKDAPRLVNDKVLDVLKEVTNGYDSKIA